MGRVLAILINRYLSLDDWKLLIFFCNSQTESRMVFSRIKHILKFLSVWQRVKLSSKRPARDRRSSPSCRTSIWRWTRTRRAPAAQAVRVHLRLRRHRHHHRRLHCRRCPHRHLRHRHRRQPRWRSPTTGPPMTWLRRPRPTPVSSR